jgi:hypothetical protein
VPRLSRYLNPPEPLGAREETRAAAGVSSTRSWVFLSVVPRLAPIDDRGWERRPGTVALPEDLRRPSLTQ